MSKIRQAILGATFGLGSHSRLTANAPTVLRKFGLINRLKKIDSELLDLGDFSISLKEILEDKKIKYLTDVYNYNNQLKDLIYENLSKISRLFLIGGDHSISIASIAAAKKYLSNKKLGLLWIDAHADLNTVETSPSGNIHGMGVAIALGLGEEKLTNLINLKQKILPENIVYIGLRDLDPGEQKLIKDLKIKAYTISDIDHLGIGKVVLDSIQYLENHTDSFIASFDLDVCDPSIAPGVGTPVRGGLSYREAHFVMEEVSKSKKMLIGEFVEFNPGMDSSTNTCELAISLIESMFGKKIL